MTVDYEPPLNKGYRPDLRLTHKNYYPVNVEIEMKKSKKAYEIKKEKAKKVHSVLLYIDGSRFELDSRTVTWVLDQLDFLIEQSILKAEAPVRKLRYTYTWKWVLEGKKGDTFKTPRRNRKYRDYKKDIKKLYEIEMLVRKSYKSIHIGRIVDVYKIKKENLKKDGRLYNEYQRSVAGYDKNDEEEDMITIVEWKVEEVLQDG